MKHHSTRISVAILLVLTLTFCAALMLTPAAKAYSVTALSGDFYTGSYGYVNFASESHGAGRQSFYAAMADAVMGFHTGSTDAVKNDSLYIAVSVDFGAYGITYDEAVEVYKVFREENPEFWWIAGSHAHGGTNFSIPV